MREAPVVHSQRMSTAAAATTAVVSSRALEARADSCEASSDATLIIMATFATRPHHCRATFAAMYFLLSGTVPIRRLSIIIGSASRRVRQYGRCAPASGQISLVCSPSCLFSGRSRCCTAEPSGLTACSVSQASRGKTGCVHKLPPRSPVRHPSGAPHGRPSDVRQNHNDRPYPPLVAHDAENSCVICGQPARNTRSDAGAAG